MLFDNIDDYIASIDTTNRNQHGLPAYCIVYQATSNGVPNFKLYTYNNNGNSTYPDGWYRRSYSFDWFTDSGIIIGNPHPTTGNFFQSWTQAYLDVTCISPDKFVTGSSNSSSDIPQEYTEFWFPLVSIGAFCAICWLLYRIIIKRLLP